MYKAKHELQYNKYNPLNCAMFMHEMYIVYTWHIESIVAECESSFELYCKYLGALYLHYAHTEL